MQIARASVAFGVLLTACSATHPVVSVPHTPLQLPRQEPHVSPVVPPAASSTDPLPCLPHARIDTWEQKQRRHPRGDQAALERGAPIIPRLKQLVADAGLPPSLALLPAIESGFRPGVRGRAGERGLWQFRPKTARRFGLVVTAQRDDRMALDPATRAAVRFLSVLHARYGDWPLALAAYNAGETRVDRALASRPHASFWQLADAGLLPSRTRDFVPRFFALARLDRPCPERALVSRAH